MKTILTRITLIATAFGLMLYLCLILQHEHRWLGSSLGFGGLLLWPGSLLSQLGFIHTWVFALIAIIALIALLSYRTRTRHWAIALFVGVSCAIFYVLGGALVLTRISVRVPEVTPYDSDPAMRAQYIDAYRNGFRTGIGGVFRSYCFAPPVETHGFGDGMSRGNDIYYRALGRRAVVATNGGDPQIHILKILRTTDVRAIRTQGITLQAAVAFLNNADFEYNRTGEALIFECSDHLRQRRLKSMSFEKDRPIGAGYTRVLSLLDLVHEVCASAHVQYVILGNRVVFVDDDPQVDDRNNHVNKK